MKPLSLDDVALRVGGTVLGDPSTTVSGVAGLREAGPSEISFLARKDYLPLLRTTRAGAVLVGRWFEGEPPVPVVVVEDPDAAFTAMVEHFAPVPVPPEPGVHPTAFVDPSAALGEGVSVGPGAIVEADCRVGARTVLRGGSYLGRGVRLGEDCLVHPRAVLHDGTVCGDRVVVNSGAVLGCDGFGFLPGGPGGLPRRVPQNGIVRVGSDVDIGACTTVARARFGETVIGNGVKIDCQVMIAHNVRVGDGCILVAQSGISGSSRLGRGVTLAGQTGVVGHVEIGDGATLAARAVATRDVPPRTVIGGFPGRPHAQWLREEAALTRLARRRKTGGDDA